MTTISAIQMSCMAQPPRPQAQAEPLSDEQKSLIEETLASYDSEGLSQADAQSIIETFQEAGIQPSQELEQVMSEFGFDAKSIGETAGMQPPPPPPANEGAASLDITDEVLQNLNDLINDYYSDNLSDDEREAALSEIKSIFAQTAPEDGLINTSA